MFFITQSLLGIFRDDTVHDYILKLLWFVLLFVGGVQSAQVIQLDLVVMERVDVLDVLDVLIVLGFHTQFFTKDVSKEWVFNLIVLSVFKGYVAARCLGFVIL